jgi:hypothetical protein
MNNRKEWTLEELKLLQSSTGRRKLLRAGRSLSAIMAMAHLNKISTRDNKISGGKHYSFTAYSALHKSSKIDPFVLKQITSIKGRIKYALEQMLSVTLITDEDFQMAIKGIKVVHFTYLLDVVNDSLGVSIDKIEYLYHMRDKLFSYNLYLDTEQDAPELPAPIIKSKSKSFTINLFNLQLQADVDIENESTFSIKSLTIKLRELM